MIPRTCFIVCFLTLALVGCRGKNPDPPAPAPVTYLDQGWTDQYSYRQKFYHTTQGTKLVPYKWFLALEQPAGGGLMRDDIYLDSLRFIPNPDVAEGLNPDRLPIGFTKELPVNGEEVWLGLTCAACHTGQIEYKGARIRIDGGPAMADMTGFFAALDESLQKTALDDVRFSRFAKAVLGDSANEVAEAKLRADLTSHRNAMPKVPPHLGFGRQDAFGAIFNAVTSSMLAQPENYGTPDAPVSFPFLWNTPQLAWVQWNGLAANPMGRNIGEVLGVFGYINLTAPGKDNPELFTSSARLRNLHELEQWIDKLQRPEWPERLLGKIDEKKKQRGKEIYEENERCSGCHSLPSYPLTPKDENSFGKQFIKVKMIPKDKIGTDPRVIDNMSRWMAKTGNLAQFFGGKTEVPPAALLQLVTMSAFNRLASKEKLSDEQRAEFTGYRLPPPGSPPITPPNLQAYKARPLNGIWATAPYLHNGSVATLHELLLPEDQRKPFHIGSREFDPVKVGFVTAPTKGSYEVDTHHPGSLNTGHNFGKNLTDEERSALVEFLKTL